MFISSALNFLIKIPFSTSKQSEFNWLINDIFCSTTINVFFNFFARSIKVSPINDTIEGCIPSAGSSNITISGLNINALAIANCCC